MPQVDISQLPRLDLQERIVRRVRPADVMKDTVTGQLVLIPASLTFNDDLSTHREKVILANGSTVEDAYAIPPNGAIVIPVAKLDEVGARLTETPIDDGTILGAAHASVWGIANPRPSRTEKTQLRDVIIGNLEWLHYPEPVESDASR